MKSGLTPNQAKQLGAKTLWIGDIEPWMDENHIQGLFSGIASLTSVKLIKDKVKGTPVGYGFIEFPNHEIAHNVITNLNGTRMPNSQKSFKLNWASHNGALPPPEPQGDFQVYVGNLDHSVTSQTLTQHFKPKYSSLCEAKVITDMNTKASKGYGFLRFTQQAQAIQCMTEQQGQYLLTKPLKLNYASQKKTD